jgi:hypothetical protein
MQAAEQKQQQKARGNPAWAKGRSANPAGKESKAARAARIDAKVVEWLTPLGGVAALKPVEIDLVRRAAELEIGTPKRNEDPIRRARMISGLLMQAGVCDRRRRQEPVASMPRPAKSLSRALRAAGVVP